MNLHLSLLLCFPLLLFACCTKQPCLVPFIPSEKWHGTYPYCLSEVELPTVSSLLAKKLRLADMIDVALQNNPKTAKTWSLARSSAYNWQASKSQLYPGIDAIDSITYQYNSAGGSEFESNNQVISDTPTPMRGLRPPNRYQWVMGYEWTLSYLLLDFGGRDASIESAKQALFVADWNHNVTFQQVVLEVIAAYYNYENIIELLRANKQSLREAKENLEISEAQYEVGVKTHVDALQAKSNYYNFLLSKEQLEGQSKIALGRLATSMGLSPDTLFEVELMPAILPLNQVSQTVEELMDEAKNNRPELASAYSNYLKKHADWRVAYSAGKPTLSSNFLWQKNVFLNDPLLNNLFVSATVQLNVPVFHGCLYENLEKKAVADIDVSYAELLEKEAAALFEVVSSYFAYKTAIETLKYSEEYLLYSQESFDALSLGYKEGINAILDLMTAQSTLASARAQVINARIQWATALANLSYATGRL